MSFGVCVCVFVRDLSHEVVVTSEVAKLVWMAIVIATFSGVGWPMATHIWQSQQISTNLPPL